MTSRLVETLERPFDVTIELPGAKSIANRALVCAALADGASHLAAVPDGDDTEAMLDGLRVLGVGLVGEGEAAVRVDGTGGRLRAGPLELDARLAGTTSRFLTAVTALGLGPYRIDGDPALRRRPMGPLHDALRTLGASVDAEGEPGHLPVVVRGGSLQGGTVRLPGDVSSQFLTALALIGPLVPGGVRLEATSPLVSRPYLAMTQSVMAAFGAHDVQVGGQGLVVPASGYRPTSLRIEPDASTASYFAAAAALTGSRVRLPGLGRRSVQGDVRFFEVLEAMGADVEWGEDETVVRGTGNLQGVDVDLRDCSDTVPTLATTAAFASSPTRIRGVGFIRAKESDRIGAVVRELRRCGVAADETDDGLVVRPGEPTGARVETYDDHRMAMAFALVGLRVTGIEIADADVVAKSFPGFWSELERLRVNSA